MIGIGERITHVHERIAAAARWAERDPREITLVGVSKTHPAELVQAAFAAGLTHFGENRVQEAESKISALATERQHITWHLIGHLQRNKAKRAAALFDLVHAVDSVELAQALSRSRSEAAKIQAATNPQPLPAAPLSVLIQVNVSGEVSKDGFDLAGWEQDEPVLDRFRAQLEPILALEAINVRGLMTIAPWTDDPRVAHDVFRSTRRLRDALARTYSAGDWGQLSMGMSNDFEAAIAEGATMVRIGRTIFGDRI